LALAFRLVDYSEVACFTILESAESMQALHLAGSIRADEEQDYAWN
jgi:hypothetical protein